MDSIYIMDKDLDDFVIKHLRKGKDIHSLQEIIDVIEELDNDIEYLKEKIEYKNDYPEEEADREKYLEEKYEEEII